MKRKSVHHVKSPVRIVHGLACAAGILVLSGAGVTFAPRPANALPKYAAQTGLACGRCHVSPAGGGPRTAFGKAFAANGHKLPSKKKKQKTSHKMPAKPKKKAAINMPQVVTAQKPDQWLVSRFKGADVFGSNGKKVGRVTDILFDASGKVDAYLVSVDGISGTKAKEVAIVPHAFKMDLGKEGQVRKLKVSMNGKQLAQAPTFDAKK